MTVNWQRKEGLLAHKLMRAMRWPLIVTAINIAVASLFVLLLVVIGQLHSPSVSIWMWTVGLGAAYGALKLAQDRVWDEFALLIVTTAIILLIAWFVAKPLIGAAICAQGCITPAPL